MMTPKVRRRRGRPRITDRSQVMSHPLSMRVSPMLYNALKEATQITGRSLSNEVAIRLERSFGTKLIAIEREIFLRRLSQRAAAQSAKSDR